MKPDRGSEGGPGAATISERIALYGPLLLALYFVAASRWGSFLTPGPPYVGDIALGLLIAHRVWLLLARRAPEPLISRVIAIPSLLLIGYAVVWFAAGSYTTDALRDLAPYLYAVLVFFGQSYRGIPRVAAERLVYGALIFHAAWYSFSVFEPSGLGIGTPGEGTVSILELRSDFDGAMVGVLAALALDRTITGKTPVLSAGLCSWALSLVLFNQSRASLGATIFVIGLVGVRYLLLRRSGKPIARSAEGTALGASRRPWVNPALALAAVAAAPLIVAVTSGSPAAIDRTANIISKPDRPAERAATRAATGDRSGLSKREHRDRAEEGRRRRERAALVDTGEATFEARLAGWEEVAEWIGDQGDRIAIGAGFGPHYMQLSGADVAFLGPAADPSVRAVHNYGINTWARLGFLGVVLVSAIGTLALIAAIRVTALTRTPPDLDLLAAMLVVAIPVAAMLGVVLETPFGAIPYFWAVGYLSARMVEERLWQRLPVPARISPEPQARA